MNVKDIVDHISDWIKDRAEEAHAKSLVVGVSGGVDSAVVLELCIRTGLETHGVIMPCDSTPSAMERAKEVIETFKPIRHFIDLKDAFESIKGQEQMHGLDKNACEGALRSCLRAPTLDYIGKLTNGLIVGTGNRDEDEVTRYFQNRGDGVVDISPIAKFHKSEVYSIATEINVPKSVIDATPSADLWGGEVQEDEKQLGLTYKEVEWGIRTMDKRGPLPHIGARFFLAAADFSGRKREILLALGTMELDTRHKLNPNLPVCPKEIFA